MERLTWGKPDGEEDSNKDVVEEDENGSAETVVPVQ